MVAPRPPGLKKRGVYVGSLPAAATAFRLKTDQIGRPLRPGHRHHGNVVAPIVIRALRAYQTATPSVLRAIIRARAS